MHIEVEERWLARWKDPEGHAVALEHRTFCKARNLARNLLQQSLLQCSSGAGMARKKTKIVDRLPLDQKDVQSESAKYRRRSCWGAVGNR